MMRERTTSADSRSVSAAFSPQRAAFGARRARVRAMTDGRWLNLLLCQRGFVQSVFSEAAVRIKGCRWAGGCERRC